ncbi:hypothetical protein GH714_026264 [Hevea brasiliensis]|uniref:Uncharacterized protein n=1 Tax=Hevea brasiliensis TaxID=3981 RepID=A0A6A6MHT7_HEVBR|nr:hypothetical protein GH714_026264 [Hevea brasiliensis]
MDDDEADMGSLSQKQSENAVDDFRAGNMWVLISTVTDVVARGLVGLAELEKLYITSHIEDDVPGLGSIAWQPQTVGFLDHGFAPSEVESAPSRKRVNFNKTRRL